MVLPDNYSVYTSDEVAQIKAALPKAIIHWDEKKWLTGIIDGPIKDKFHKYLNFLCLKVLGGFYIHLTLHENEITKRGHKGVKFLKDYEFYSATIENVLDLVQIMLKGLELEEIKEVENG